MMDRPARCQTCSAEHPTGAGYVRRKGRHICGQCAQGEKDREATWYGLVIWIVLVATAGVWIFDEPMTLRGPLTTFSMVWVVSAGLTVLHEAGHTLTALALRVRVLGVDLGADGPVIASFSRGRFALRLRLLPVGGKTYLEPARRAIRIRHIIILAAGPMADAALIVAALMWHPTDWLQTVAKAYILFFGALSVLINLVIPLRNSGNDAAGIWQLIMMQDDEVDALSSSAEHDEFIRMTNQRLNEATPSGQELDEIRTFFVERVKHPGLDEPWRALAANNLAAVDIVIGRQDLLAEADEMSRFAYETLPIPAILSTRGSALVALGHPAEGARLLEAALPSLDGHQADSTRASLALALLQTEDLYGARIHLAAINGEPNLPAYREVRKLIGVAEVSNLLTNYWESSRSPSDVAAMVAADAGAAASLIGRSIAECTNTLPDVELADLFAERAAINIEPKKAVAQLATVASLLTTATGSPS